MAVKAPSALALAAAIKAKDVSPVEIAKHYLSVIDERNQEINAFIWRRDDDFLKEAKLAEDAVMRGDDLPPFHGVPLPLKDLTEALGQRTTHGSRSSRNKIGRYDTTPVKLLREAGFLFMGRTNTPEFGSLPVTENLLYGPTRNPHNLAYSPGGSSGGAAAAVASGMAPIAHGSDGGGSLRIPASCCGLVGLKASRARIPKGPLVSEVMHGFTTDGCISVSVEDTAAFLDVISRYDPTAWMSMPAPTEMYLSCVRRRAPRLRIGMTIHSPYPTLPVDQSCIDAVTKTASVLSDLGHEVTPVKISWPYTDEALARDFIAVWCTSAAYQDVSDWSEVEPLNLGLRDMAQKQTSFDYLRAVLRLQVFSRKITQQWGSEFDVLLTPTLAMEPPKIGWMYEQGDADVDELLWRATKMVPFSGWCNMTGQPAISLPTYVAPSGLPIGVQLVGAPGREDLLLMLGAELEEAISWPQQFGPSPI